MSNHLHDSREFYLNFPGFTMDWEHGFHVDLPLYLQVSRDGCILHLTEHHGDCSPGAALRIQTTELDVFQAELAAKAFRYARPSIEDRPWGIRDMSIQDPFGNTLTFTEPQVLLRSSDDDPSWSWSPERPYRPDTPPAQASGR